MLEDLNRLQELLKLTEESKNKDIEELTIFIKAFLKTVDSVTIYHKHIQESIIPVIDQHRNTIDKFELFKN